MDESSLTVRFIFSPFPFKLAPVRSKLNAPALPQTLLRPLAHVDGAVFDLDRPILH